MCLLPPGDLTRPKRPSVVMVKLLMRRIHLLVTGRFQVSKMVFIDQLTHVLWEWDKKKLGRGVEQASFTFWFSRQLYLIFSRDNFYSCPAWYILRFCCDFYTFSSWHFTKTPLLSGYEYNKKLINKSITTETVYEFSLKF